MKARYFALAAAAGATAAGGLVWWRRRSVSPPQPALQLGLRDGAVHTLDQDDSSRVELEVLAAAVRDSLTGGS